MKITFINEPKEPITDQEKSKRRLALSGPHGGGEAPPIELSEELKKEMIANPNSIRTINYRLGLPPLSEEEIEEGFKMIAEANKEAMKVLHRDGIRE